jgi:hypothetical protein
MAGCELSSALGSEAIGGGKRRIWSVFGAAHLVRRLGRIESGDRRGEGVEFGAVAKAV